MSCLVGSTDGPGHLIAENRSDGLCPLLGVVCVGIIIAMGWILGFSQPMSSDKGNGPKGTRLIRGPFRGLSGVRTVR